MRNEMRKIVGITKRYLVSAVIIIVIIVGLVFGFQLAQVQHVRTTLATGPAREAGTGATANWAGGPRHQLSNSNYPGGGPGTPGGGLAFPLRPRETAPNPSGDTTVDSVAVNGSPWSLQGGLSGQIGAWTNVSTGSPGAGLTDHREDFGLDGELPSLFSRDESPGSYLNRPMQSRGDALIIRFQPRLAIVIDDWGYDWASARDFLSLDIPFTAAVLPYRAKTDEMLAMLRQRGHEVILHLPMEPKNPAIDPGEGGITTDLSDVEISRRVAAALAALDGVVGVNNHMGSKATSDERVMQAVLGVIREQGLYFVDSWTAPSSVAGQLAEELGVPTATNQAFLDHYDDVERVKSQIERLIKRAQKDGQALGVGHVRPHTYRALVEMIPRFQEAGVIIVPASRVVSTPVAVGEDDTGCGKELSLDIGNEPAFGQDPAHTLSP